LGSGVIEKVRIIEILSFPGPDRSIKQSDINKGIMVARRYRNRRIGEFFKELKMTEGRCTGIPKIIKALKDNGSPAPIFETDENRSYFLTILKIHPIAQVEEFTGEQVSEQVSEQVYQILEFCKTPRTKQEILNHIGLSIVYLNYKRNILPLIYRPANSLQK